MSKLEKLTPIKDSMIWSLAHRFYQDRGLEVRSEERVSQASTTNCYTADVYAAIVADFLRDCANQKTQPPLIIEVGGGSGRFAWQFLNRLQNYQFGKDEVIPPFTYMLTDADPANIAHWKEKHRFADLIAAKKLAFGQLLVEAEPVIRSDAGAITPAQIADRPVVIIANHSFDRIPSDMFRIRNHEISRVLVELESDDEDFLSNPIKGFASLKEKFASRKLKGNPTDHPVINQILAKYAKREGDFYALVPEQSFRFLESFTERDAPLLMLAGDLAYSDPADFVLESPFIFDSNFAHYANFDMFAELIRINGGKVQFARHKDRDFSCGAFVMPGATAELDAFDRTLISASKNLREFNPYDAHELCELIKESIEEASYRQVFAWMRFSKYDPSIAEACLPIIFEQLQQGHQDPDKGQLCKVYMEAYRSFLPDGAPVSLDIAITQMLLAINFNDEALELIESGLAEFGPKVSRLYVYALTLLRHKRRADARTALKQALEIDPDYGPALRLWHDKFERKETPANKESPYGHLRVICTDPDVAPKAQGIFDKAGVVLLDQMIQPELVSKLRSAHELAIKNWKGAGLGEPNNVGDKRFTVPIRMQPPFNNPALFANPVLIDLLTQAMGDKPILSAFGAVVTRKGARMQHIHREHPLLFADDDVNKALPTYAVTVIVPLIDLDEAAGGTQLWENTHKTAANYQWEGDPHVIYTRAGAALTFDYRLYHGGMPCSASHGRPLIFLSYSLPWFKDTLAFESHAAVAISKQELAAIPAEHHDMFRFANRIPD